MRQFGNLKISIIDDDEAVRDSLSGLVESLGATACAYPSLAAFLADPQHGETGCVLLDWSVLKPGAAGLMRDSQRQQLRPPVVAMVSDEAPTTRERAIREGADAVLPRPFTDRALIAAISDALRHGAAAAAP